MSAQKSVYSWRDGVNLAAIHYRDGHNFTAGSQDAFSRESIHADRNVPRGIFSHQHKLAEHDQSGHFKPFMRMPSGPGFSKQGALIDPVLLEQMTGSSLNLKNHQVPSEYYNVRY